VFKNEVWRTQIIVIGLGILILVGLLWVNFQFVQSNPGGNDFLVHYVGTRSFLFEGVSPYSDEVALRIQTAAYGHPAQGTEHELRVAYPLYSILLFAPFSIIPDFELARAIWMTVLEISLVGMCFLTFNLVDWKPSLLVQAMVLLFSLVWYHAVRGIVNGNAVILVALLITLVLMLLKHHKDQPAGLLLALTTIKPHLVVLLIPLLLFWGWRSRRGVFLAWFFGSLLVLFSFSWLLIPDWILQNIWEILRYPGYNPAGTLAEALAEWLPAFETQITWVIAILLGIMLVFEWSKVGRGKFNRLTWTAMLTLAASQWIGIQTDPGNFILLFPALILILSVLCKKWEIYEIWITGGMLGFLLIGLWILFVATIQHAYQPIQNPVMFIPVPAFCLVGLYWVKWWVVGALPPEWNDSL
jgi:hypothetical protein